jgi:hypothetical protein
VRDPRRLLAVAVGHPLASPNRLGVGERCAAALAGTETELVTPVLVGGDGMVDDHGDLARVYGHDALVLVRPDGYVGLVADPGDTGAVSDYLGSW